jgi:hypothetical protein
MDKQDAGNQGNEAQKKIEVRKWLGHQDCGVTMAALALSSAQAHVQVHHSTLESSQPVAAHLSARLWAASWTHFSHVFFTTMRNRTTGGALHDGLSMMI